MGAGGVGWEGGIAAGAALAGRALPTSSEALNHCEAVSDWRSGVDVKWIAARSVPISKISR
ncbi:hypothetical protein BE61_35130 [Bradyrhizobium elkanii USDA 61]|nr:hypothetical protein BE61_35130 [Bradyrhizobium elkanii USDA 61]